MPLPTGVHSQHQSKALNILPSSFILTFQEHSRTAWGGLSPRVSSSSSLSSSPWLSSVEEPGHESRPAEGQELQQGAEETGQLQGRQGEAVPVEKQLPSSIQASIPHAMIYYLVEWDILTFRNPSPERQELVIVNQEQEMAFRVKKCLGSRKGWKIIPDNDDNSEDINTVALRTVVNMIKEMECQVNIIRRV